MEFKKGQRVIRYGGARAEVRREAREVVSGPHLTSAMGSVYLIKSDDGYHWLAPVGELSLPEPQVGDKGHFHAAYLKIRYIDTDVALLEYVRAGGFTARDRNTFDEAWVPNAD